MDETVKEIVIAINKMDEERQDFFIRFVKLLANYPEFGRDYDRFLEAGGGAAVIGLEGIHKFALEWERKNTPEARLALEPTKGEVKLEG